MVVSITRVLFALFLLFYTTAVGLRTPFIAIRRFQRSPLISATHSEEISSSIIEKWVTEEQELLKHEEFEKQRQLTESDEQRILSLPKYMQDILNTLDDEPPCLPSKLPVIVVMGRPNTGKSTIFNRISESFKVARCPAIMH